MGKFQLLLNKTGPQGTGSCYKGVYCYASFEDREHRTAIPKCECHSTCQVCGYNDDPTGYNNCVSCVEGLYLQQLNDDGSGYCSPTPCLMFCMGSYGIYVGPRGYAAILVMMAGLVVVSMMLYRIRKRPAAVHNEDTRLLAQKHRLYGSEQTSAAVQEEGQALMTGYKTTL